MTERVDVELPRDASAAGHARDVLRRRYAAALDRDDVNRATLLVTELVSNAVRHGQGTITLRARLDEDCLLVEVIDEGAGFERAVRDQPTDQIGGRGLRIVDAEASRWGIHEGTTHVWFEIERSGPRLGVDKNPAIGEDGRPA